MNILQKILILTLLAMHSLWASESLSDNLTEEFDKLSLTEEKEVAPTFVGEQTLLSFVKDQFNENEGFSNDTRTKDINGLFTQNLSYIRHTLNQQIETKERKENDVKHMLKNIKDMEDFVSENAENEMYLNLRDYGAICDFLSVTLSLDCRQKLSESRFRAKSLYGEIAEHQWDYCENWQELFSWNAFKQVWEKAQKDIPEQFAKTPDYFLYEIGGAQWHNWLYLITQTIFIPVINFDGIVDLKTMSKGMAFFDNNNRVHSAVFNGCAVKKEVDYDNLLKQHKYNPNFVLCAKNLWEHDMAHLHRAGWMLLNQPREIFEKSKEKYFDYYAKTVEMAYFLKYLDDHEKEIEYLDDSYDWFFNEFHERHPSYHHRLSEFKRSYNDKERTRTTSWNSAGFEIMKILSIVFNEKEKE